MIAASKARSSPYPVSIRQAVPGLADRISRHTSTPSPSGSRTSRTATSTPSTGTRLTADSAPAPPAAPPHARLGGQQVFQPPPDALVVVEHEPPDDLARTRLRPGDALHLH